MVGAMADQAESGATRSWAVPAELNHIRLDAFARRCLPHLSRHSLADALNESLFRINGRIAHKGDKLKPGDRLTFAGPEIWLARCPQPNAELHVQTAYEDEAVLVLNKPAGVATHGFSGRDRDTLANFLAARYPDLLMVGKSRWEPGLVHRLDRDTSGLVLVAKTQRVFERLKAQFRDRRIKKKYSALVWGITADDGSITYPIAHDARDPKRMRALVRPLQSPAPKSWKAFTRFRKVSTARGFTLLEIEMTTGVTHQIRVHLAAVGHPILGDPIYGAGKTEPLGLDRQFLHAGRLDFNHPEQGKPVSVEAELPSELREVLKNLGMK
jgi:23S rRNA pseudouridine1911/1915/1917 synthase